jgi:hypothetical protein
MPDNATQTMSLIPVFATALGAIIGSIGTYLNFRFNSISAREERVRNRLESIYILLTNIEKDYKDKLANVINCIHHDEIVEFKNTDDISALIKLEMNIKLYFPDLKDCYSFFEKEKNTLEELYSDSTRMSHIQKTEEVKEKMCENYMKHSELFLNEVNKMKGLILSLVKA